MIHGLTDRGMAFPEIGSIRKGAAKDPNANRPGKDLAHFRIDVDESEEKRHGTLTKLTNLYGSEPTAITIILPFDTIDQVWDAWREKYTAGALIHRCDGEMVKYSINPQTGERVVVNGLRVDSGQPQPCQIQHLAKPQCCVPVGRLKVIIPSLNRLAYFVVHTTSIHDIISISQQLEAIRGLNGGHIAGVPLILKRVPREISTPSGSDGKRARRVKYLISIEADPSWVERKVLALNSAAMPQISGVKPLALNAGPDLESLEDYDDDDAMIGGEVIEPVNRVLYDEAADDASYIEAQDTQDAAQLIDTVINKAISDNTRNNKVDHDAVRVQADAELTSKGLKQKPVKQASIKTRNFQHLVSELAAQTTYYNGSDGKPNNFHILGAAAKCGYTEITDDNIAAVMRDLVQHAQEQAAIKDA